MSTRKLGFAGRIAHYFINSKLTPLIMVFSILLGAFAVLQTPREEEPQIVVPMMDVFVEMPGSTAQEVEQRVTTPMEKLIWEIPGVEYIYSTTRPGLGMAIVRFKVGEKEEDSIIKLYNKLYSHFDLIPPGASKPIIKPRSIDDVPILALTFWSNRYDSYTLRRVASEVDREIKSIDDISQTQVIGGERRQVRVLLNPGRTAGHGVAPAALMGSIDRANQRLQVGEFASANQEYNVETGDFLRNADEVGRVVVGVSSGRPVYLRDVAEVLDGPEEPTNYVLFGYGSGAKVKSASAMGESPAVTLTVSKRKGQNAVTVAKRVMEKVESLKGTLIPAGVEVTVTRNYGATAQEKSNELLKHLLLATLSVTLLIALALGWRSSMVVLAAVPVTLALTLFIYFIYGYTLNRVTLFALIFSIGILVDDAIVVVENIVRHWRMPANHGRPPFEVAVEAVDEVGNPTILATLAVVAAILPMAFVGGLMGPYMRPIPIGASAAMLLSLMVAFIVTPWAAVRILKPGGHHEGEREDFFTRLYRRFMGGLLHRAVLRWGFVGGVVILLLASASLVYFGFVKVKMLPFDNKSEFQVIVDMPTGTTLEETARVAQLLAEATQKQREVVNVETYVGTASPYNFNGLVRHYYLRRGPNVADIQVNLLPKDARNLQSHEIAKQVRLRIQPIAERYGARIKVAEVPPGPPVLETLVAEVYGPNMDRRIALARQIRDLFRQTKGVVDVDWYVEDDQPKYNLSVDQEKAAINGISEDDIARAMQVASAGYAAGLLHQDAEKEDVPLSVRLDRATRSDLERLQSLKIAARNGHQVALGELVHTTKMVEDKSIYHKNLMPVTYVTADIAGEIESPVYAVLKIGPEIDKLKIPEGYQIEQHMAALPSDSGRYSMKWDGEWHITYEVFRDLGIAFAAVLILIYGLVVGWFQSFLTPLIIMAAIPFSLVGILPAHGLLHAFFTATSMIGFIAGAGIVVRNSIILVDFIELRLAQGMPLDQAVIDAGAVRFRPMMLTAAAVVVGSSVILFDPIFQGLAIALMAGEIASLLLSRMTVPVLFYLANKGRGKLA